MFDKTVEMGRAHFGAVPPAKVLHKIKLAIMAVVVIVAVVWNQATGLFAVPDWLDGILLVLAGVNIAKDFFVGGLKILKGLALDTATAIKAVKVALKNGAT